MQHGNLNKELADALARLEISFQALGETRDRVGETLDNALNALRLKIGDLDEALATAPANAPRNRSQAQRQKAA